MPRRASRLRPGLAALVLLGVLPAPARHADAAPARRAVEVVVLDGKAVAGPLVRIDGEGIRLEGHDEPVAVDRVVEMRLRPEAAPPASPAPEDATLLRVALTGGELLRGRLVGGDAAGIDLAIPGLDPVRLVFDAIRRIEADPPSRGPCDEPGREHPPRAGTDVAYTRAGDAYAGTLAGATKDGVVLESGGAKRTVRWADLTVLHVDEPLRAAGDGPVGEVETVGGSRFPSTELACDGVALALKTGAGLAWKVPLSAVAVVRWSGGRFVYASDLPFTSEFKPYYADDLVDASYLQTWYGARADRTPSGCPLRIGGVEHRHGFAVHAKSTVTLRLERRFATFRCAFGIDDEALAAVAGPKGDVTARVTGDGRELWSSGGSVKGGEAPRAVGPLDVAGVETLVLEVDFGGGEHQMDRADWADPILVRAR